MTQEQILTWCMDHGQMKRQYTWYGEEHYKITFENGATYEYKRSEGKNRQYNVTIWINGKIESIAIWHDTWLENGNYGAKKLVDLLNNKAA